MAIGKVLVDSEGRTLYAYTKDSQNGWPLYRYAKDTKLGEDAGQGVA